ncbi:hypothetical protein AB0R01_14710 [Streptomyces rochei]|uniref:hypothetical protein n=1 Tax=Streptomyces TaxID=1883 RepID=UPI001CC0E76C|nr:hypothetical protein [Streptomyces sp. A144]UAX56783.1 hypothetical protein K5X85_29080 [Streptomyces sp. A144]
MATTADDIAARLAPPPTDDGHHGPRLQLSDAAMQLADAITDLVPDDVAQAEALGHLEACLQAAHRGVDHPDGAAAELLADTDRGTWELGVRTSQLGPFLRLTALALGTYADADGRIPDEAQPTLQDLCHATGLSLHHLHYFLRDLDRAGWLARETTTQGSTRRTTYALTLPASQPTGGRRTES